MRGAARAAAVALGLLLGAAGPAAGALRPEAALPDWDVRGLDALGTSAAPSSRQLKALEALRRELEALPGPGGGELVARWGPYPGTLHHLFRRGGFLGPPDPRDAEVIARELVARHRELLGLDAEGVRALRLDRRSDDPDGGARHVAFVQVAEGLPVFHGEVRVHLAADGRVLSVGGNTMPAAGPLGADALGPARALVAAARSLGLDLAEPAVREVAGGRVVLEPGSLRSAPWASEAAFPLPDRLVRAWVVVLDPPGPGWYQVVVDAATGAPLARFDLEDAAATEGLVFREDPGAGPQVRVPFVDDAAWTDPASPRGWSAAGATEGDNCDVKDDVAADDELTEGARAVAAPGPPLEFAHPFTGPPAADRAASCTNLFWLNNWLHDRLARMGFDEASGNFQAVNASGRGLGGDRVLVDAQDGGGTNNANFGTPPDGSSPRMQMYVWTYTDPPRDSGFDASVVTHEYLHGVSHRLVGQAAGHAGCLGGGQGGALGEAWSDYFACSFWDRPTVGSWLVDDPVRGIRRAAYDAYPWGYGDLCNQGGFEVHRDGEIWAATLWDLRSAFQARHGRARGRCLFDRLVLDAMKLSPCFPGYVDMRDALLLAAQLRGDSGDACVLWQGFAARGLGVGAVPRPACAGPADASSLVPPECAACAAARPPADLVLDAGGANRVVARFTPSPDADEHVLLRADGSCPGDCAEASFVAVASGGPGAAELVDVDREDGRLSAGERVAYRVVARRGACTAASACAEAVVTGRCTRPPRAAGETPLGVTALLRPATATCALTVAWSPAAAACGRAGELRYNVYRSEDPSFAPSPRTLVASVAAPALEWTDRALPPGAATYVVRAEDLTTAGPGPHGGNEERNDVRLSMAPVGEAAGPGDFVDDGEGGELPGYRRSGTFPVNDWALLSDAVTRGGSAWHSSGAEGGNADKSLHLPPLVLGDAPRLEFVHAFRFEDDYDGGVLEISLDGGRTWRDLAAEVTAGGYETCRGTGRTRTLEALIHPPNTDRVWTGENPSGFPAFDRVEVDLAPHAHAQDAQIRFRMLLDPLLAEPEGWYVDDIAVRDVVLHGECAWGCRELPQPAAADVAACLVPGVPTRVVVDASASRPGAAGWSPDAPLVLTASRPGLFGDVPWAMGPAAELTFPADTPPGTYVVTVTARGADGCAAEHAVSVRLDAEAVPLPAPVGASLRVSRAGADLELAWDGTGAAAYNVHATGSRAEARALEAAPPVQATAATSLALGAGALPAGPLAYLQVFSASSCGRSVR